MENRQHVRGISEVNLRDVVNPLHVQIDGYKLLTLRALDNPLMKMLRIMVYVRDDVDFERMEELETDKEAMIWILIKLKNKRPIRVGNVYREHSLPTKVMLDIPTGSAAAQIDRWDKILDKWEENCEQFDTIVMGDMNIDYLKYETVISTDR